MNRVHRLKLGFQSPLTPTQDQSEIRVKKKKKKEIVVTKNIEGLKKTVQSPALPEAILCHDPFRLSRAYWSKNEKM